MYAYSTLNSGLVRINFSSIWTITRVPRVRTILGIDRHTALRLVEMSDIRNRSAWLAGVILRLTGRQMLRILGEFWVFDL